MSNLTKYLIQDGRRPLTFAATNNRVAALQYLLENGADPNLPNRVCFLQFATNREMGGIIDTFFSTFHRTDGQRCTLLPPRVMWK